VTTYNIDHTSSLWKYSIVSDEKERNKEEEEDLLWASFSKIIPDPKLQ